jgi:hypothetical protein
MQKNSLFKLLNLFSWWILFNAHCMTDLIRDHAQEKKDDFLFPPEFHIAKELNNGTEIIVMTKLAKTMS